MVGNGSHERSLQNDSLLLREAMSVPDGSINFEMDGSPHMTLRFGGALRWHACIYLCIYLSIYLSIYIIYSYS